MGSPYLSQHRESDPQGKLIEVWVQERGKSEGSSVMEGIGVEQTRKITPPDQRADFHEVSSHKRAGQTDQGGKADDGPTDWCSFPR